MGSMTKLEAIDRLKQMYFDDIEIVPFAEGWHGTARNILCNDVQGVIVYHDGAGQSFALLGGRPMTHHQAVDCLKGHGFTDIHVKLAPLDTHWEGTAQNCNGRIVRVIVNHDGSGYVDPVLH